MRPAGVTVSLAYRGRRRTPLAPASTRCRTSKDFCGSSFNDTLTGNGNSVLEGGAGNDILIGQGAGQSGDTASYEHATSAVTVNLTIAGPQNTGGAGTDTLTNIANLYGLAVQRHPDRRHAQQRLLRQRRQRHVRIQRDGAGGHRSRSRSAISCRGRTISRLDYAGIRRERCPSDFGAWLASHVTTVNNGSDLLIDLNGNRNGHGHHPVEKRLVRRPAG